jgi:hypothetical protein
MRTFACLGASLALFVAFLSATAGEAKFQVKTAMTAPPDELSADVKKLFSNASIQLQDDAGKTVAEFWFRPETPVEATPEQVKNGLSYKEVPQTEVLGTVRFDQDWTDYRKQKVKAGVYTLRLGYQPADGDHQGSSEFQDFLVVTAAAKDTNPELVEPKEMIERSAKSINSSHPGVFMLFPVGKADMPKLETRARNHLFLATQSPATIAGKKAGGVLGIGMTLVGHAE